jgi:hypothetical protein
MQAEVPQEMPIYTTGMVQQPSVVRWQLASRVQPNLIGETSQPYATAEHRHRKPQRAHGASSPW